MWRFLTLVVLVRLCGDYTTLAKLLLRVSVVQLVEHRFATIPKVLFRVLSPV